MEPTSSESLENPQPASASTDESAGEPAGSRKSARPKTKPEVKPGRMLKVLVFIQFVLLVALAGGAAFWYQTVYRSDQQRLTKSLSGNASALAAAESALQGFRKEVGGWKTQFDGALTANDTALQTQSKDTAAVRDGLLALQDKLGTNDTRWKLAEVEYLLTLANERLQLASDKATALAALQTADQRLVRLADPRLTSVRASLASEIQSLSAHPQVDITGIVLELSAMETSLVSLPLLANIAPSPLLDLPAAAAPDTREGWREFVNAVWHDVKDLVVIRKHDRPVEPLLPPDERRFLMENLKLRLNAAKLAVLRRDTKSFHAELQAFRSDLLAFFDAEDQLTQGILASVQKFEQQELDTGFPDITGSLLAVRQLRKN